MPDLRGHLSCCTRLMARRMFLVLDPELEVNHSPFVNANRLRYYGLSWLLPRQLFSHLAITS